MLTQELGFGVVGLGMGQAHCADIVDAKGARLVAVCDVDPDRLNAMVKKYQVRGYSDYEEMLKDSELEAVSIATPSGVHADMTAQAAHAGKHILCEKPPDVTVAQVDRMLEAARANRVKLAVVFQNRFSPLFGNIKEAIGAGRLGRLVGVHGAVHWLRLQAYYDGQGGWRGTWAMDGGGSLANQGVHTVDLMQWLAGRVSSVFAYIGTYAHQIESEDKTVVVLKFENGALGTLTTTTAFHPGYVTELVVHGTKGSVVTQDSYLNLWRLMQETEAAELDEEKVMLAKFGPPGQRGATVASDPMALSVRGHLVQVEDLVAAIREDREPSVNAENARHSVEIVNAIYRSARTGREVALS